MKIAIYNLLLYGLPIIGTIGLALGGVFFISHKSVAIWTFFFSIVFFLLAVTLYVHKTVIRAPEISLNSVKIYHVEVLKNIYQIGILCEVANLGDKALLLKEVVLKGKALDIAARSASYLFKIHITKDIISGKIVGGAFLGINKCSLIKVLLPIKFDEKIKHPPPPEIVFWGLWEISAEDRNFKVEADYYGNYDKVLSFNMWESLLSSKSIIDPALVRLKAAAKLFEFKGKYFNYLLYNQDRSAEIDIYGFDKSHIVRNDNGTMVFLVGPAKPPLRDGWKILGNTYPEVWSDSKKLKIYNSVYPPDENGKPRSFGAFSGREEEMGVNGPVPNARGRDIYRIHLNENKNEKTIDFTSGPQQSETRTKDKFDPSVSLKSSLNASKQDEMNSELKKAIEDLTASVNILESNIDLHHQGNRYAYRVVASQLRLLLCDGKNSLLPRLFIPLKLHPILGYITKQEDEKHVKQFGKSLYDDLVFQVPFEIYVDKGLSKIAKFFDEEKEPIGFKEWIDQPLVTTEMTLKDLIKSVADKEAVHSDKNYNETLKFHKSRRLEGDESHKAIIISIGEYVVKWIRGQSIDSLINQHASGG